MDEDRPCGEPQHPDEDSPSNARPLGRGIDALMAEGAAESARNDERRARKEDAWQGEGAPVPPWRDRRTEREPAQILIPAKTAVALYAGSFVTALLTAAVVLLGAVLIASSFDDGPGRTDGPEYYGIEKTAASGADCGYGSCSPYAGCEWSGRGACGYGGR